MRKNLIRFFIGFAVFAIIGMLSDTSYAQKRMKGYSKQRVEQLLERIEERTDKFIKRFDEALDDSSLDTTRREENYTDRGRELENYTDELRREFDHDDTRGETTENIRKVMRAATVVNRIMNSRNFGSQTETSWIRLRSELNTLAQIYRLPNVGSRNYR